MSNNLDHSKYFLALASRSVRRVAAMVHLEDLDLEVNGRLMKELSRALTWQREAALGGLLISDFTSEEDITNLDSENLCDKLGLAVYSNGQPVSHTIDHRGGRATLVSRPDSMPTEIDEGELEAEICPDCLQPRGDEPEIDDGEEGPDMMEPPPVSPDVNDIADRAKHGYGIGTTTPRLAGFQSAPKEHPMVSSTYEPADLASFRARRAARKEEHRRQQARDNFTAEAPDYGREIPPRLNPDVLDMADRVKACYFGLTQWIVGFQHKVVALVDAGKLDPRERTGLLEHYRHLQEAVDAATTDALMWHPVAGLRDFTDSLGRIPDFVHRLADHAKYVYAVGTRDIAAMQYRLAELAHTGRLDPEVHRGLQWNHRLPMWETLYHGTTSAVRDERTWDGGWAWSDNTYSDGRQVMAQVRVKNWQELDRNWPYNGQMCGDGPIQEHPRGTPCQIYPVVDSDTDHFKYHPAIDIDLDELIERLGPPALDVNTLDDLAIESAQESLLLETGNSCCPDDRGSRHDRHAL